MRTIEIQLYEFDELSDKAKENARIWWREYGLDYEWWDFTGEDAKNIHCEIASFDTGRSQKCDFKLEDTVGEVARAILANHGAACDTYKLAQEYYRRKHIGAPMDAEEFRQQLSECYLYMLTQEYEYLNSDESVDESIRANGYEFTAEGSINP